MRYTLLHSPAFDPTPIAPALAAEEIEVNRVSTEAALAVEETPTVFVLDPADRRAFSSATLRRFTSEGGGIIVLGAPDERDAPDTVPSDLISAYVPPPHTSGRLLLAARAAFREVVARGDAARARQEAASRTRELGDLTRIGMALTTERDLNTLLGLILTQARQMTSADAGSLYLVEGTAEGGKRLRFKLSQNFSRPEIPFVDFTIPFDQTSIAGYVASTGEPLVLDDAYQLPPDVEYSINRSLDEKYGYRTKSMLTLPMRDHKEQVIGVLQLLNRKRTFDAHLSAPDDFAREVMSFSRRSIELVSALAGQAAVSIENSQLYESIERLFEGFVKAAVTAIEQRDPTTFGHSGRVATMTVGLAETVDQAGGGSYRNVQFSREELREIRYAGLLHDFGKVGVREQVLVKAKKLYLPDLALIRQRHAFIRRTAERDFHAQRAHYLEHHGAKGYEDFVAALRQEHDSRLAELDRFIELVLQSNEPTVLPEGNFEELVRYAGETYETLEGERHPLLSDDEVRFLTIRKGSLDDHERLEIESHVSHTYRFLLQIPWTKELQNIPYIAYGHHEKLNGSGYPRKATADQIPIQTRMMTIADIFDALTASDRPYKRAVPVPRALDIMAYEVKDGMLDESLFKLFVDAKVFDRPTDDG